MKKVIEIIDAAGGVGTLVDKNGLHLFSGCICNDLEDYEEVGFTDLKELIKLKEAGFSADEIVMFHKEGLL